MIGAPGPMKITRLLTLSMLVAVLAACGGAGTAPTPVSTDTGGGSPPAGASTWLLAYRAATAQTCPNSIPDAEMVIMTVAPGGSSLVLAAVDGSDPILFNRDATGMYVWLAGPAGISFRFLTSTHGEGAAHRDATPDLPCSATWPVLLDRQ